MEQIEIHEAGLLIRPWMASDADAVLRACQDPDIQRWTTVPRPYLREHAEGFVTVVTERGWAEGTSAPMGVFDPATGELLGACGLVRLDLVAGQGEIGYWVAPWARRWGVASRAARAVARWALGSLGLVRLIWQAEVGNHASLQVAEEIGVRVEGVLRRSLPRVGGGRSDGWVGSLLPGELREADATPLSRIRARTFQQPQPTLPTARPDVTLRPLAEADIEAVLADGQDPETVRWTTIPNPYRRADAVSFVLGYAPECWLLGVGAQFAVADADDAWSGIFGLRLVRPRVAEVGFSLASHARGRGYGTAALRALCAWGYAALDLHRIEWRAYVGNEASRRLAQRAGFTMEATQRGALLHRGVYRDAWSGARLATDTAGDER